MAEHNPYAPTAASLRTSGPGLGGPGLWRDDDRIIAAHGCRFPDRCVKCNAPTEPPNKVRKVYWHHPAIYVLFFLYAIVYVIVALIVRKTAKIDPGLCAEHRRKRRNWIIAGWLGSIGGFIGVFMVGAVLEAPPAVVSLLALLCMLSFAILGIVKSRVLYPARIDDRYAKLKGADPRFLESLPDYVTY